MPPLHDLFLAYERDLLGAQSVSMSGRPFLSTELAWLDRYVCERVEDGRDPEAGTSVSLDAVSAEAWAAYPAWLYARPDLDRPGLERAVKRAASFLAWLAGAHPDPATAILQGALKTGARDVKRLHRIHAHLSDAVRSRVFTPGPTDDPETIDWQEGLATAQWPAFAALREDTFTVRSKNRKSRLVYLLGRDTREAIVLRADPALLSLLLPGDRLPLKLGATADGLSCLLDYDKPQADPRPAGEDLPEAD